MKTYKKTSYYSLTLTVIIGLALLSACGGGGGGVSGGSSNTVSSPVQNQNVLGIAAVGSPIVAGQVSMKCLSGLTLSAVTDASGVFNLPTQQKDFPCMLQLTGGSIKGLANQTTLHSVALQPGIANITTLTELVLAASLKETPSISFQRMDTSVVNRLTTASLNAAHIEVANTLINSGLDIAPVKNAFTSAFNATPADPIDSVLEKISVLLESTGTTLNKLSNYFAGIQTANPLLAITSPPTTDPALITKPGPAGSGLVTQYDPSGPDVILAIKLLSPVTATTNVQEVGDKGRAQIKVGGSPNFDPAAGVTVGYTNPSYIRFLNIAGIEGLTTSGWQLYFEVDRQTLALLSSASAFSGGMPISNTQYPISFRSSEVYNNALAYNFTISNTKTPIFAAGSGSSGVGTTGIPYNDVLLPVQKTHVPIILWGYQDQAGMIMDGVATGPLFSPSSLKIANVLELYATDVARVRNLMLVARPPIFVEHPTLKTMAILGDSYSQFFSNYSASGSYSASTYLQALAQVTKAGRKITWPSMETNQAFPGHHVMGYSTGSQPLHINETGNGSSGNLWDKKELMLGAYAPDILVMQSGANDVSFDGSQPDITRWQAWVLEWARWSLGEGGYAKSSIKKFAFSTTPWSPMIGADSTMRAARLARYQAMRQAAINALDQFALQYPNRAQDVMIIDQFTAFGGAATPTTYFSDINSTDNGIHPSLIGNAVKGQTWGAAIVKFLEQ